MPLEASRLAQKPAMASSRLVAPGTVCLMLSSIFSAPSVLRPPWESHPGRAMVAGAEAPGRGLDGGERLEHSLGYLDHQLAAQDLQLHLSVGVLGVPGEPGHGVG